jgi:hypothetical protein
MWLNERMDPQPPVAPSSGNPYQFITDPVKPPRRPFLAFGGGSFIMKLAIIIGGAVVLMIGATVIMNTFFGDKTNLEGLVGLTQNETELALLSQKSTYAEDQAVKGAAANTGLTAESHKRQWITFLATHGREVSSKELVLKHDATIDKALISAQQASTFDVTFTEAMRGQLDNYAKALQTATEHATSDQELSILKMQYDQVQLLLKQWPQAQASATNP